MRPSRILLAAAVAAALAPVAARACGTTECLPPAVAFPVFTHEGTRVGTVESAVRAPPTLDLSPTTGQPLTVVYSDPSRLPGSVSPHFELVPLPRAAPSHTRAVYPRGG